MQVADTDRGAAMTEEQKAEAGKLIAQLEKVGTKDPLKDPRIFGGQFTKEKSWSLDDSKSGWTCCIARLLAKVCVYCTGLKTI